MTKFKQNQQYFLCVSLSSIPLFPYVIFSSRLHTGDITLNTEKTCPWNSSSSSTKFTAS